MNLVFRIMFQMSGKFRISKHALRYTLPKIILLIFFMAINHVFNRPANTYNRHARLKNYWNFSPNTVSLSVRNIDPAF